MLENRVFGQAEGGKICQKIRRQRKTNHKKELII